MMEKEISYKIKKWKITGPNLMNWALKNLFVITI